MTYYCKLKNKSISLETKHKHLKSKKHKNLEDSIIMRNKNEEPDITQLIEIMQKSNGLHNKKNDFYQVRCVLKVNDKQYLSCKPMLNQKSTTYPYITSENRPFFLKYLK